MVNLNYPRRIQQKANYCAVIVLIAMEIVVAGINILVDLYAGDI